MAKPRSELAGPVNGGLERLVETYLAHQGARGLSPRSVEQGVAVLGKAFLPWCRQQGIAEPDELDQKVLDRWSSYLLNEHRSPSGKPLARETVRTYNRAVGQFTSWAQREGSLGAVKPQHIKKERRVLDVLSREEINRLEDAATDERDKLIIRLLADTGLRLGELLSLRLGDLLEETQRRRFLKVRGKGGKERKVPCPAPLYQRLLTYAKRGRPRDTDSEYIFLTSRRSGRSHDYERLAPRSLQNMLQFSATRAGLKKRVHPHLFRHSFATWALRRGMNEIQLRDILGHVDLTMIAATYSHLNQADAYDALSALLKGEE